MSSGTETGSARIHTDLGNALAGLPGRMPEAISRFETVLRLRAGGN